MAYVRAYPQDMPVMRELLPGIETPVQIMSPRETMVVPPINAAYFHRRLPNSRLDLLDTAHFPWEDRGRPVRRAGHGLVGGGYGGIRLD